jgi:phage baseplate assembly protein W
MATKDLYLLQSKDGIWYANFSDIIFQNNDIMLIADEDNLRQQVVKIMLTERGTTQLFPNYGTILSTLINQRLDPVSIQDLRSEIIYALKYIKEQNIDETINIDILQTVDIQLVNSRELNISLVILLTNGKYLQINEMVRPKGGILT